MTSTPQQQQPGPRRRLWMLAPVLVFAGLAVLFMVGLQGGDPSRLPSALVGKPAPALALAPLEGLTSNGTQVPGLASADINNGKVTVLNVWASWCGPCRDEHPQLIELVGRSDINLVGLNYKDQRENAVRFLTSLGNPFSRVGADTTGRTAVDWGVYGVPETYVIDASGTITYKFTGPLTPRSLQEELLPAIARAQGG
jgi:cytochrome c biogenesis protein CcmG/thiol:disulfide interchange protein DsbE